MGWEMSAPRVYVVCVMFVKLWNACFANPVNGCMILDLVFFPMLAYDWSNPSRFQDTVSPRSVDRADSTYHVKGWDKKWPASKMWMAHRNKHKHKEFFLVVSCFLFLLLFDETTSCVPSWSLVLGTDLESLGMFKFFASINSWHFNLWRSSVVESFGAKVVTASGAGHWRRFVSCV